MCINLSTLDLQTKQKAIANFPRYAIALCSSYPEKNNHMSPVYQSLTDEHAIAQQELNQYVEAQARLVAPEIEVDSDTDADFGVLYRVWSSRALLGTFYRALDGKWVVQPCNSEDRPRCNTAADAQLLIVAMSGLLVADSPEETVNELLDKPFDELTIADWQAIKQQALATELLAA